MNLQEIKKEIKSLFVNLKAVITLNSIKTKDDQILSFEGELAVGTPVFIIQEDATQIPAPDADYILEDDSIVKIVNGIVDSITPAQPADDSITPAQPADAPVTPDVNPMEERIANIEVQIAKILEILNAFSENMSTQQVENEVKMSIQKPIQKEIKREVNERSQSSLNIVLNKLYN